MNHAVNGSASATIICTSRRKSIQDLIQILRLYCLAAWETSVEAAQDVLRAENERSNAMKLGQVVDVALKFGDNPGPAIVPASAAQYYAIKQPSVIQQLPVEAYHPVSATASPPLTPTLSEVSDTKIKSEDPADKSLLVVTKYEARPESPPKYDVQHQSICFFVHLFCFQANRLYSFPVIDFIPYILQHADPTSPVQLAATAVSRMTLADQYSGTDIRLQTGHDYSRAIKSTMATIRDPHQATSDSSVVAVWLLGLYEAINAVLNHGRSSATSRNHLTPEEEWQSHISHIRGAMHLLRLRGTTQLANPRSEKIFRIFKAAIQMRLFCLNSVTSRDFGALELDVYADEHEFVPSKTANRATSFFISTARLTEKIKHHLFSDHSSLSPTSISKKVQSLITYGLSLDTSMKGWSTIEPGWEMMKVRASATGTAWSLYPNHAFYYFYSFWVYLYWIRYLIARVKLYESLIELVKSDPLSSAPHANKTQLAAVTHQINSYTTIIQLTASQLIGLTAYALGDVANTGNFNSAANSINGGGRVLQEMNVTAAMQLVIPLKTLLRNPYTTSQQRGALDLAISHIGDGFRRQPGAWA